MRIAQVAPLHESVPPQLYGGTERIVSYLTEELVRLGHEVTLFASGDSRTSARLNSVTPYGLRLDRKCQDPLPHHFVMLDQVFASAHEFDLVHFHTDYLHFLAAHRTAIKHVTTLHGRLDIPDLIPLYQRFSDVPLVSISDNQRKPLPWANWRATVSHGLPENLYRFYPERGAYLAFIGRVSPEKRVDRAIEIAQRAGIPLRISAKIDKVDASYFAERIRPLLNDPLIEYAGEITEQEKEAFLGNALAVLFPIDWPEPFGLVMIEAMACGTPVIAYHHGSVPEVIQHGVTGFIVENQDEAVKAVNRVVGLDRSLCRRAFEQRFTVSRMARNYLSVYQDLVHSFPRPKVVSLPLRAPTQATSGAAQAALDPIEIGDARDCAQ